jgi:general secretion pathway protein J
VCERKMKFKHKNGFTLLEILLVVSLLSLITASIAGGIHLGTRSWEASRSGALIDEVEGAARSLRTLISKTSLVRMAALSASPTDPAIAVFFGNSNSLRFLSLSEGFAFWGGPTLTDIGFDYAEGGSSLSVWTSLYRPDDSIKVNQSAMKKTTLIDGVVSFRLSYFGAINQGQPSSWNDTWTNREDLPKLISFTLSVKRMGKLIEISSIVAVIH